MAAGKATPAIQLPRDFAGEAGVRAGRAAIEAIRIRLERMEARGQASADNLTALRAELIKLIKQQGTGPSTSTGRARPELMVADAMSAGDVIALSPLGAVRADTSTPTHAAAVVGLAYELLTGGRVSIAADGDQVQSDAWSWNTGDILYASGMGTLSTGPGSSTWVRRIGVAVDSRTVMVVMGEPVRRVTPNASYLRLGSSGQIETASIPYSVDNFVANGLMLAAKEVSLSGTPVDPEKVELIIYHGIEQRPNVDFIVSGGVLSWDGLALEALLADGDAFTVRYLSI